MRKIAAFFLLALVAVGLALPSVRSEEEETPSRAAPDAATMERIRKMNAPGPEHEAMKEFLGDWSVRMVLTMPGPDGKPMNQPVGEGTATVDWAVEGRWLLQEIDATFMGAPYRAVSLHGYENHRKSFVTVSVSNHDTSLNIFRGVKVDPEGEVFTEYGTIYEYLDGTYDKPVKTVVRKGDDGKSFTMEVWDLQIGVDGAMVLRFDYQRKAK